MAKVITAFDDQTNEPVEVSPAELAAMVASIFTAGIVLTPIYSSPIRTTAPHDTNDANPNESVKWENLLSTSDFVHDQVTGQFIAQRRLTVQASAFIAVTDATANNRACFYTVIQKFDANDNFLQQKSFSATFIRDDLSAFDDGASGGTAMFTLDVGDYLRVTTRRLYSQDPTDDNPADQALSNFQLDLVSFG